jgi:hypothetical protein
MICWCDQSPVDRDEIIVFDFGSKTTWFKYTGNAGTGQLSMHPTIGPIIKESSDSTLPALKVTGDESCPVCTRVLFQRSIPSLDCSAQRLKKASKFIRLRNFDCFGMAQNNDSKESSGVYQQSLPHGLMPSTAISWRAAENVLTYEFLIRHMLRRNPFFHIPDIPFVVCEPMSFNESMKCRLTELLMCDLKVPE